MRLLSLFAFFLLTLLPNVYSYPSVEEIEASWLGARHLRGRDLVQDAYKFFKAQEEQKARSSAPTPTPAPAAPLEKKRSMNPAEALGTWVPNRWDYGFPTCGEFTNMVQRRSFHCEDGGVYTDNANCDGDEFDQGPRERPFISRPCPEQQSPLYGFKNLEFYFSADSGANPVLRDLLPFGGDTPEKTYSFETFFTYDSMTSNLNRVHNVHYEDRRFTDPSITSKNIVLRLEWAAGQRAFKNAFIQVSQGNRDGSGVIYGKIMQITSDADEVLVQLQDFAVQEDQNTFTLDYSSVGNISVTVFVQNIPEGNYAVVSGEGGVDVPIPEWENRPSGELHAWNFQFVDVIDNAGTLELDLLESDRRFYFERFGNIEGTDNIAIRKAHYFCGKSGTDQIVDTVDCGEQPSTAFQFFLNQNLGTAPLVIRRCQDLPSLPTDDAVVDYSPFGTEEFADYDFTESGSDGRKKLYEGDWVMFRCPSVFINATYTAHYIEKEPEEWKRVTICNIDGEWSSWYNEWEGNMACEPIGDYVWNFDAFGPCTDYDTHRNNVQYRDVWCAANIEGREELPVDPAFCTRPKPEITRACPYVVTAESETIR